MIGWLQIAGSISDELFLRGDRVGKSDDGGAPETVAGVATPQPHGTRPKS
jgi:hypothetical protein